MSFTESNLNPGGFGPVIPSGFTSSSGSGRLLPILLRATLLYGSPLTMWWLMGAGRIAFLDRRRPAGFQQ